MDKETINKAADEFADQEYETNVVDRDYLHKGFYHGALWRINSAWHDGTTTCEARRKALVLFKNGNAAVYKDLRDLYFERLWGEVDKFAYLDDLLPEKRKEDRNGSH